MTKRNTLCAVLKDDAETTVTFKYLKRDVFGQDLVKFTFPNGESYTMSVETFGTKFDVI
jgi:hypothetical protein